MRFGVTLERAVLDCCCCLKKQMSETDRQIIISASHLGPVSWVPPLSSQTTISFEATESATIRDEMHLGTHQRDVQRTSRGNRQGHGSPYLVLMLTSYDWWGASWDVQCKNRNCADVSPRYYFYLIETQTGWRRSFLAVIFPAVFLLVVLQLGLLIVAQPLTCRVGNLYVKQGDR